MMLQTWTFKNGILKPLLRIKEKRRPERKNKIILKILFIKTRYISKWRVFFIA